jgi:hypothetical protein
MKTKTEKISNRYETSTPQMAPGTAQRDNARARKRQMRPPEGGRYKKQRPITRRSCASAVCRSCGFISHREAIRSGLGVELPGRRFAFAVDKLRPVIKAFSVARTATQGKCSGSHFFHIRQIASAQFGVHAGDPGRQRNRPLAMKAKNSAVLHYSFGNHIRPRRTSVRYPRKWGAENTGVRRQCPAWAVEILSLGLLSKGQDSQVANLFTTR